MPKAADPQDVKSEEALLGAILIAPAATKNVAVKPDDFYNLKHGLIWDAALKCANNGGADPITVAAELARRGQLEEIGGRDRLALLAGTVPAAGNASAYAKRVAETAEYRRMRRSATALLDAVTKADDTAIAQALDTLGHPIRFVDVDSGEMVDTCPTCAERDELIGKLQHRERSMLSTISKLEGQTEKKAKGHKLWDEIQAVHEWWRLATGHFGIKFTAEEFQQALPRWKEHGRGKANPCIAALKAVAGAAFDPNTKRMKNGRIQRFDSWEIIHRSPEKFESFQERAPGPADSELWKVELVRIIEGNFRAS